MTRVIDDDIFIAGGGPAGLAVAIAARLAGFSVSLADCGHPPIDKACGEGILPAGVAALEQLGVSFRADEAFPLRGIKFVDSTAVSRREERAVEAVFPGEAGLGIRRTVLHLRLAERACAAGVTMRWRARAVEMTAEDMRVDGEPVRSRWLICADGQNSRLREQAGLGPGGSATGSSRLVEDNTGVGRGRQQRQVRSLTETLPQCRFGFRRHYRVMPWSEFVEVHWSDCGQLYVTPVAADQVSITLLTRHPGLRLEEALGRFPAAAERLLGALPISRPLGGLTVTRRLPAVQRANLALIGDASGSVDAITGEGLTMAFHQALALAAAMRAGDLSCYQHAHRRIIRLPYAMARLMLAMDRHHGFRQRVLLALEAEPSLFARLVAIHIGARPACSFGVAGAVSLGWRLLTAETQLP
jgi:flavin-dependent dehydrogenase